MKPERFRTHVEIIHKQWLTEVLCLSKNHDWVDLYTNMFHDMELYFELKCRMLGYRKPGNEAWACPEEQIKQYKETFGEKNVFWIFLIYKLDRKVKAIRNYIARKIIDREVWIIPWNYIYQFESKWCRAGFYRYPKQRHFPKDMKTLTIDETDFHYTDKRIGELLTAAKEMPF